MNAFGSSVSLREFFSYRTMVALFLSIELRISRQLCCFRVPLLEWVRWVMVRKNDVDAPAPEAAAEAERSATYDFIRELAPDVVQLHIFNVYPGAPAMEAYPELYAESGTKFTGPTELDRDNVALDDERRTFYRRYYLSPSYIQRALRRRWRPLLHNLGEELGFAWRSTRFFLGGS